MKIVALAGGVGGAKLAHGLSKVLPPDNLTVIVNTGDDFYHYGLKICPDLDTVCYTLGDIANSETGWGRESETWAVLSELEKLGSPGWFRLGDKDIALHMERTRLIHDGDTLSSVVDEICRKLGVRVKIYPMTNDPVSTHVITTSGNDLTFQEYFVKNTCSPVVKEFRFENIKSAKPTPGVIEALEIADFIIFCPSNPWVSIDPILNLVGVREIIALKKVIMVSPIVGGKVIKGPAAKMFIEMGIEPSTLSVVKHYLPLVKYCILDELDQNYMDAIGQWGIISYVTDTVMKSIDDRIRLARFINDICLGIGV